VNDPDSWRRLQPQLRGKKAIILNLTYETLDLGDGRKVLPASLMESTGTVKLPRTM